ncbi:unnamed protein product [Dicrocoelium dendriticum]|nr:unnamed protein product [Dicrocoelium dendriticum]
MYQTNRSSLKRDSALRRSLGGIAAVPLWLSFGDADETASNQDSLRLQNYTPRPSPSNYPLSPVLRIRVSQLPSLDSLGFALDSYVHPLSDEFVGLRLCDRFRSRQIHFETRKNCPLRVGDVIVMVNQHKLSTMHESQAIRYVYNAFRDARQYIVEFGVYRLPEAFEPSYETKKKQWHADEGITSTGRAYGTIQRSATFLPPSLTDTSLEQHRPRRTSRSPVSARHESYKNVRPSSTFLSPDSISFTDLASSNRLSAIADQVIVADSESSRHSMLPVQPASVATPVKLVTSPSSPASPLPSNHRRSLSNHTLKDLNAFNTRTIGRKICIDLVKLADGGLGFTLTSRDTRTSMDKGDPVYVKKILSSGAAIADGRLSVGDRLLSVNGIETINLNQVSAQLRSMKSGECVRLIISRQICSPPDENLKQKSPLTSHSVTYDSQASSFRSFTYEFQLPNDVPSGSSPSLGINFKWLTRPPNCDPSFADVPGLYVDSLLPDGLVLKSGRSTVLPGDRLVGLNGEDLEGLSAKAVSQRVKQILANSLECGPRTFSLTVHRYCRFSPQNLDEIRQSSYRRSTSVTMGDLENDASQVASNQVSVTDCRRRRTSICSEAFDDASDGRSHRAELVSDMDPSSYPRYLSVPPRTSGRSCFEREGLGRRSVSEKRHGHLDPSQFSFFQTNILPARYKMPEDVDKQYSTMPTARRLKLHRERLAHSIPPNSSSGPMKALHPSEANPQAQHTQYANPVEFAANGSSPQGDPTLSTQSPSRFHRRRKQNNSFRNAVDRSLTLNTPDKLFSNYLGSNNTCVDEPCASQCQSRISQLSLTVSLDAAPQHPDPSIHLVSVARRTQNTRNSHPSSPSMSQSPISSDTPPIPARQKQQTTYSQKTGKLRLGSFKDLFKRSHNRTTAPSTKDCGESSIFTTDTPNLSVRRFSVPATVDAMTLPPNSKTAINESNFRALDPPSTVMPHFAGHRSDEVSHPRSSEPPMVSQLMQSISPPNKTTTNPTRKIRHSSVMKNEQSVQLQIETQSPPPVPPRAHHSNNYQKSLPKQNKVSSSGDIAAHNHHRGSCESRPPGTNEYNSSHRSCGSLKAYSHEKYYSYRDHSPVYMPKQPSYVVITTTRNHSRSNGLGFSQPSKEGKLVSRNSHSHRALSKPIPVHSEMEKLNSNVSTIGPTNTLTRSSRPKSAVDQGNMKTLTGSNTSAYLKGSKPTSPSIVQSGSSNCSPACSVVHTKSPLTHSNYNKTL